jgi:hypothetical protein
MDATVHTIVLECYQSFSGQPCEASLSKFIQNQNTMPMEPKRWWSETFSPEERGVIDAQFRPIGAVTAESMALSDDPKSVGTLAAYMKKEAFRQLGYRLLDRADTLVSDSSPIMSLHFYFSIRGSFYYRWRDMDKAAMDEAVDSYRRQVGLAPIAVSHLQMEIEGKNFIPSHAGYKQLRIIEEKRGNLMLARELCIQANAQGWMDDWGKHIARLDKKIAKETPQ